MKTKKGLWAVLGTVLGLALVAGVFLYLKTLHAQAQGDVVTDNTIPVEDNSRAKGSVNNPFVILEIVPYLGYAELGYLIDGCEPVDVEELCRYPEKAAGVNLQAVTSFGGAGFTDKIFEDEGDTIGKPSDWILKEGNITLFGYYEYVGEGKGYLKRNGTGYDSVGDGNGDIIWVTTAMSETREIKDRIKLNNRFSQAGDRLYGSRTADGYYTIDESNRQTRYRYVNYDDFIRNTIGVTEREKVKNYNIIVKTITPSELNAKKQWVDRADLISLSPKIHVTDGDKLWEMYNRGGMRPVSNPPKNFYGDDLEWATALRIFEKVNLKADFAAIVVDWGIYTDSLTDGNKRNVDYYVLDANGNRAKDRWGTEVKTPVEAACNNNIFKLLLIMKVMDPNAFYNYYLADMPDGSGPLINADGEFRAQTGNARTYWNRFTFMPYVASAGGTYEEEWKKLADTVLKADVLMGNNNSNVSVRGRMYTFNGNNPINQKFMSQDSDVLNLGTNQTDDYEKYLADHPELKNLPATAIRFILGLPPAEEQEVKPKLTILDVEPCNSFTMTERYFRLTYIPTYMGPIDFVRQNSQEFNGKIEDLNTKYDLIYLGINDGDLNKSGGRTVYNDTDLNGFIYLGIGDKLYSTNWGSMGGANRYRGTNWITGHTNGNSLANREMRLPGNDITDLRSQYLVEYLDAGYPVLAESELLNATKVDSSTNISKFVNGRTESSFILTGDSDAQTKVSGYVLKNKPLIVLSSAPDDNPAQYNGTDADNNGRIDSPNYLPSHSLKFKFKINDGINDGSVEYGVRLYADANADGRFAGESTNADGTRDSGEIILEKNNVRADGRDINITKSLSGMLGSIPWKLEVYSKANEKIRYSVTGLAAIRRAAGEKQLIKILQIKQNVGALYGGNNLDIATDPTFQKFISDLNDYRLDIKSITISEFEELYKNGKSFNTSSASTKGNTDQLAKNYDMLIFGFSDYYENISNVNGALDNLQYFIDCGKSVLFTHDVTSFNNVAPENSNISGVNFNIYFRGLLSMDRFGVRQGTEKSTGKTSYQTLKHPKKSGDYWATHGFTFGGVTRQADISSSSVAGYKNTPYGYRPNENPELTQKAKVLNDGQITSYPYEIEDEISIAATHGQYYQLQMEDKDVVVWYCLAPNSTGARGSSMYGLMPNDASNNYYIYNKGNITYSGVGHSTVNGVEEVKLLVNTMIAAYKAGFQPPAVEILNVEAMKNSITDYFYFLNVDHASGAILDNPIEDIRFKVEDANLISNDMAVWVAFESQPGVCFPIYKENPDGSLTEVTDKMSNKDGTKTDYVKLKAGDVYVFKYDTANMADTTKRKVIITAENKKGLASETSITFMNRLLFNLD